MRRRRSFGAAAAVLLTAVALVGCGGSSPHGTNVSETSTSQLNPATHVPSSALVYALVTVKTQGSLRTDLVQTIDKLAGPGAANRLAASITSSLGTPAQIRHVKAWLGNQVGIALTGLPTSGPLTSNTVDPYVLLVAPTTNPAAAERYIAANLHDKLETVQTVGHFVIAGGKQAVTQAVALTRAQSLASSSAYASEISQLGGNLLASVYLRPQPLATDLSPLLSAQPSASQTSAEATQVVGALKSLPADASIVVGAGAGTNTLRLDVVTHGLPQSDTNTTTGDVGSLPASSWLALDLNLSAKTVDEIKSELPALINQAQSSAGSTLSSAQGLLPFVEQDVIPALGPASLSIAGNSVATMQIGLQLDPLNAAAGDRLVTALQQMLTSVPVQASKVGNKVVVTYGYASPQDLTSPASQLADDPTYKAALAQLPPGSKAPLYVNFGPIAGFASLDTSASDASVWKVVKRLRYLIVGGTSTHTRIVLAVN